MKGISTGLLPNQVKAINVAIKHQNKNWVKGLKASPLTLLLCRKGQIANIAILAISINTPPSLLGIVLNIVYANRKYHSGIICTGVTKGLAFIKFSGSPNKLG